MPGWPVKPCFELFRLVDGGRRSLLSGKAASDPAWRRTTRVCTGASAGSSRLSSAGSTDTLADVYVGTLQLIPQVPRCSSGFDDWEQIAP